MADGSFTGAYENGPAWAVRRLYTTSADMQTAAPITLPAESGKTIIVDDILVSVGTAMEVTIQMEDTSNVLASFFLPASGTQQVTPRDGLRADLAGRRIYGKGSAAGQIRFAVFWHEL